MKIAMKHSVPEVHEWHAVVGKQTAPEGGMAFSRQMTKLSETHYQHYINDLQERIYKQGERLKEKADLSVLSEYRQLIGELLGETASNAFACIKSRMFDAKGRHKVVLVVRSVNQKLEQLAAQILSEQSDNIKLLQLVDDIRGLLVDLFM